MLDVGRGILRMHQPRDRIFQLAAVDDHRRVHREQFVLARVVDMQVRVQHVADVAHPHAVLRELVLDHVLVELEAAHAEALHDLVMAIAGVDHEGPGSAQDQKAVGRHTARAAAIAPQHEEAQFKLDIAVVEHLDFQSHLALPFLLLAEPVDPARSSVENLIVIGCRYARAMCADERGIGRPKLFDREVRTEQAALRAEKRERFVRDEGDMRRIVARGGMCRGLIVC